MSEGLARVLGGSPLRLLVGFATILIACWSWTQSATAETHESGPGYRVLSTKSAQIHDLSALAVSKDGSLVAVGTLNGTVQVWDWRRATMVSLHKFGDEIVDNLFFLDEDRRLAVFSSPDLGERHMFVWEIASGTVADEGAIDGNGTGYPVPDGTIAIQNGNGIAFIDQQGKRTTRYVESDDTMLSPSLSPDGQLIVSGGRQQYSYYEKLIVRDSQGKLLRMIDIGFDAVDTVFSPDSKIVAVMQQENGGLGSDKFDPSTNGYDLYDVATGKKLRRFSGHSLFLVGAVFSPDSSRFLTWSGDQTLILWDVRSGEMIHRLEGHRDLVSSAEFLADGSLIASAGSDGSLKIWSAATGREVVSMHAAGEATAPPSFIALRPDGHFFEGGPIPIQIIKVQNGEDGPALTKKERTALKLQAFEVSAH